MLNWTFFLIEAIASLGIVFITWTAHGAENVGLEALFKKEAKEEVKEEAVETTHSINLNGEVIGYKAIAGLLPIKNDEAILQASLSYITYKKDPISNPDRPITFCFNGGPGAASLWLHMGLLGPKRIQVNAQDPAPPYQILDNPYCLLDLTDLVFIDPMSTGYSRPALGLDAKQFHGVEEDIKLVGQFIREYLTKDNRWNSPKFLIGESYGTTRAAGLANHLHDVYSMNLNGIVLISCLLNYQTIIPDLGNDLPYILFLPSYTAAAWAHQKLDSQLMLSFPKAIEEARNFAMHEYASALLQGDALGSQERSHTVQQLSRLIGLSPKFIDLSNMRVCEKEFEKELLRDRKQIIGRFDSRSEGISYEGCESQGFYDPSFDIVCGAFSAAFNSYIRTDLKWMRSEEYRALANVSPWNYGSTKRGGLDMGEDLQQVLTKNSSLKVFVASGYFDLAIPYFATIYTFNHLGVDPTIKKNIQLHEYEGGHMMFLDPEVCVKMKRDLTQFYLQATAHHAIAEPPSR